MKADPYFSVVIPSRNRPALARTAISSVLAQSFEDLEVVFLENSDPECLLQESFGDPRLRISSSPSVLGMPANWERLFEHVTGRYVILIADKDQLNPRALELIHGQARTQEHPLITFGKTLVSDTGVVINRPREADTPQLSPTKPWLKKWFEDLIYDADAPMLYNSAVHRDLLRKTRPAAGRFFAGGSPDIASSIALLAATKTFLNLGLPLAVGYFGAWSNGYHAMSGRKNPKIQSFFADLKDDPFARLGVVPSMPGGVAETAYACKRAYPDLLTEWNINWDIYPILVARELVLSREEGQKADISEDWELLARGAGGLYSHRAFMRARMFRLQRRLANRLRRLAAPGSRRGQLFRAGLDRLGLRPSAHRPSPEHLELSSALREMNRKVDAFLALRGT